MRIKKAQATRMLVMVMTVVIVGLVLVFGYRAITSITVSGEKATLIKFKNEFINAVDQGSSYGRVAIQDFSVGGEYKRMCLAGIGASPGAFTNALVKDALASGTSNNAFLLTDSTIEPFEVKKMEIEGGGQCFSIDSGKVKLRFEGKGDRTKISLAT